MAITSILKPAVKAALKKFIKDKSTLADSKKFKNKFNKDGKFTNDTAGGAGAENAGIMGIAMTLVQGRTYKVGFNYLTNYEYRFLSRHTASDRLEINDSLRGIRDRVEDISEVVNKWASQFL